MKTSSTAPHADRDRADGRYAQRQAERRDRDGAALQGGDVALDPRPTTAEDSVSPIAYLADTARAPRRPSRAARPRRSSPRASPARSRASTSAAAASSRRAGSPSPTRARCTSSPTSSASRRAHPPDRGQGAAEDENGR
jgi:hypothetical protein